MDVCMCALATCQLGLQAESYTSFSELTPFCASYFNVSLSWGLGKGIADTLGKYSIILLRFFYYLLFFFVSPSSCKERTGEGGRFKCLTDQYLPPYHFSGIFCFFIFFLEVCEQTFLGLCRPVSPWRPRVPPCSQRE